MNEPDPLPPIPSNFGLRYVLWWLWCNAIQLASLLQGAFASILLVIEPMDPNVKPPVPRWVVLMVLLGNAILTGMIARTKRNNPPPPPPVKVVTP